MADLDQRLPRWLSLTEKFFSELPIRGAGDEPEDKEVVHVDLVKLSLLPFKLQPKIPVTEVFTASLVTPEIVVPTSENRNIVEKYVSQLLNTSIISKDRRNR